MLLRIGIPVLVGAAAGAALGHFGRCADGGCPLTANWRRGMLCGAFLGLLFALSRPL